MFERMSAEENTYHQNLKILSDQYLKALLNKNRQEAELLIFDSLQKGTSIKDIYLSVFQTSQWEIGRLWQLNFINVAMEHYCTAVTQFIMSRLYDYIFTNDKKGLGLVATSVSGELHELGIRMVADFFEMEGWNTYYLGANSTPQSIIEMVKDCEANVLAISATIYFNVPKVKELISYARREHIEQDLVIMVGGNAFKMHKDLWIDVGADLYANNAQEAIKSASSALT